MVEMKTLGSENPQVGSVVSVKDGTRKYKSTLVARFVLNRLLFYQLQSGVDRTSKRPTEKK